MKNSYSVLSNFKKTVLIALFFVVSFSLVLTANFASAQGTTNRRAQTAYQNGKDYIANRDFERGIKSFEKAVELDNNYFEAHYNLGVYYNILRNKAKTKYHFKEAVRIIPNDPRRTDLYIVVAGDYLEEGKYEEAEKLYQKAYQYAKSQTQKNLSIKGLATCKFAVEGIQNPLDIKPERVTEVINARKLQYFAVLTADEEEMYFTARESNDPRADEDILRSVKKDSLWQTPEKVTELNTKTNEGTCTISADGRTIIFTICEGSERGVYGRCDLFISEKQGDKWSEPKNMGDIINTRSWESQASLSADGRTLYFISDRSGGFGRTDIWKSTRNDRGVWEAPQNLGSQINTAGEEYSPFIHVNGRTLFFSSDTHLGFGGFDLFKTEIDENSEKGWTKPQNLGYPINTYTDQQSLFVTADGKTAYYADGETELQVDKQNRIIAEDLGNSYIYKFEMPEEIEITVSRYIKGTVYDAKTKEKLGANIDLYNLTNKTIQSSISSDPRNGKYLFVLNEGSNYALNVNKKGYLFQSLAFDYSEGTGENVTVDIYLEKAEKGSKVVLNNIFFDTDKWELKEESKTELDLVTRYLQTNPKIKVQISGHTDNVGDKIYNQKLSEKRATSVVDYLINAGIPKAQLVIKGFGEAQPQVENNSAENKAKNRRIEFEIL
ncbi:OmpA family protein [Bernardetia sp. ABR2-2B]|uniref:OmpA family protein n=1 Tax=Bernardetia sp. ABR2-2B TaxID=3127472 RepID=UPI0030CB8824